MTEQKNALARLFAAYLNDGALKASFMTDPKAIMKKHGLDVHDGIDVEVVENNDDTVHVTLSALPTGDIDLSDDVLSNAAGGGGEARCNFEEPNPHDPLRWRCRVQ